ncbi:histidine phosphatase family protein [Leptothermofonsia sp. ETS-13]|uniref:histidine phosphatase family protein n=1 Tax=Leptothermofonsia sp. ETS-13 TaxID=3035696 RepID=UPI003BA278FB
MSLLTNIDWEITSPTGTRVILVRHGQSTYNAEKRHQGSCDDSVLTPKGRRTAYQTGLLLRELKIAVLYVSPLRRAQETAQEMMAAIATKTNQLPTVTIDSALKEISLPLWEGLPYQTVREQFAEDYHCWKEQPHQFQMMVYGESNQVPTGSSTLVNLTKHGYPVLELYERTQRFWQKILPQHRGETIVIVSHAGTNRALLNTALGMSPSRFHSLQQSNCGISVLHFSSSPEQLARLERLNSTDHLGEALPKLKEGKQGLRLLVVPSDGTNPGRIQTLAQRLESVVIDFSISNDLDCTQLTTKQLLQQHPQTVQFPILRDDFPQAWQQTLASRHPQAPTVGVNENRPLTALVVAQEAIALKLLSQLLDIKPQHLHLHHDTLTVIHYPQTSNNPILQSMNIGH